MWGFPEQQTCPFKHITKSVADITTWRSCEIKRIPQFNFSDIFLINSYKAISPLKSTPCTGSSNTKSSGFFAMALAIKTLWNSPPDKLLKLLFFKWSTPVKFKATLIWSFFKFSVKDVKSITLIGSVQSTETFCGT